MTTERPRTPDLLSGKAIFRLGLGLVILAAVMFFRYSVEQGWIEPPVRVAMAGLAAIAMIVVGGQIVTRRPAYGTLLQGGGSAVLYLTVFAAHQRYGLIEPGVAFLGLAGVSTLIVTLALRHSSQALGIVGVIGALAAPSLIDGRLLSFGGDATYVAAVLAAGITLFIRKEWALLYTATAIGSSIAVVAEAVRFVLDRGGMVSVSNSPSAVELTLDALIIATGLWIVPVVSAVRRSSRPIEIGATVGTLTAPILGTAVVFAAWYDTLSRPTLMTVAVGTGLVAGIVGMAIRSTRPLLAETQLVPALVLPLVGWFTGIDTPAVLLLVVVTQAAAMTIAGTRVRRTALTTAGEIILALALTAWIGMVILAADSTFDTSDAALGAVLPIVAYTGIVLRRSDDDGTSEIGLAALWLAGGGAVAWAYAALNGLDNGPGLVTAAWALLGAGLVTAGKILGVSATRNTGIGLLLVAVGKLLLVDTVGVSGLVRMGLFAGIGLGLLLLGYWLGDSQEEEEEATPLEAEIVESSLS